MNVRATYPIVNNQDVAFELPVDSDLVLKQAGPDDVGRISQVISDNLQHLLPYLRLEVVDTMIDSEKLAEEYDSGHTVDYLIMSSGEFSGMVGLHSRHEQLVKMGYWLAADRLGQGIATRSATRLRDYAFSELDISRLVLDIQCTNQPSKAVATRLGAVRAPFPTPKYETWIIERPENGQIG